MRYAMAVVVEAPSEEIAFDSVNGAIAGPHPWDGPVDTKFIGDPVEIPTQDEYDSEQVGHLFTQSKTDALTQIQHIAYDGGVVVDAEEGKREPLSEFEQALAAKLGRICNIAEAGEADEDFRAMLEKPETDPLEQQERLIGIIGEDRMPADQIDRLIEEFDAA